jgi:organic hydroperoxide reductase OsmC/OhrA
MSESRFQVELTRRAGYALEARPAREGAPTFQIDETPPLGEGAGATPSELLGAAVGSCLTASLLFCMEKARISVDGITTRVEGTMERNEKGRLRISGLRIELNLELAEGSGPRADRCLELFEDFCIVGGSVQQGIPLEIVVNPAAGASPPAA